MDIYKLSLYSILHMLVDFISCYCVIFAISLNTDMSGVLYLLCYNFMAFAMQAPLGILLDYSHKTRRYQMLSFILLMLGLYLTNFNGLYLYSILCVGLGNSFFHVSFGYDILKDTTNSFNLGIFISTGALGVSIGSYLALTSCDIYVYLMLSLLIAITALSYIYKYTKEDICNNKIEFGWFDDYKLVFILLMLVVLLRSYMGGKISLNLGLDGFLSPIFIIIINTLPLVLGKAFGGYFADKYGFKRIIVVSLCISTVSSLLFYITNSSLFAIITIFTFNMTMPLTLYEISKLMKSTKAFSFGLLSFCLFIGYVISLYVHFSYEYVIVSIISCVCLYYTTERLKI